MEVSVSTSKNVGMSFLLMFGPPEAYIGGEQSGLVTVQGIPADICEELWLEVEWDISTTKSEEDGEKE